MKEPSRLAPENQTWTFPLIRSDPLREVPLSSCCPILRPDVFPIFIVVGGTFRKRVKSCEGKDLICVFMSPRVSRLIRLLKLAGSEDMFVSLRLRVVSPVRLPKEVGREVSEGLLFK